MTTSPEMYGEHRRRFGRLNALRVESVDTTQQTLGVPALSPTGLGLLATLVALAGLLVIRRL